MFKKKSCPKNSCLNCAYLGNPSNMSRDGKPVVIEALPKRTYRALSYAVCFHEQWRGKGRIRDKYGALQLDLEPNMQDDTIILTEHKQIINLSKHSCKFFFSLSDLGFRTLKKCWEEQQEEARKKKDRRRFWISTFISLVTAVAVVATAFLTWRNS